MHGGHPNGKTWNSLCRPPCWTFYFRLGQKLFGISPLEDPTLKTRYLHLYLEYSSYLVYELKYFQFKWPPSWVMTSGYIGQCSTQLAWVENSILDTVLLYFASILSTGGDTGRCNKFHRPRYREGGCNKFHPGIRVCANTLGIGGLIAKMKLLFARIFCWFQDTICCFGCKMRTALWKLFSHFWSIYQLYA